jgi:hypothetical protein
MFAAASCFTLFACGGDDGGGGGGGMPDAKVFTDAPAQMDAPPAMLMGLGQKCVPSMMGADCPSSANGCLSFASGATSGICTKLCVASGTFMTDAMSQPTNVNPDPTTQNATCTAIYSGTTGSGACEAFVNIMPAPPLQANMNYTFAAACIVKCGAGNTCPSGLTCDTQVMWCKP